MKNKVMIALVLAFFFGLEFSFPAHADDSVIVEPTGINLSDVFSNLRGGTMYTFYPDGMTLATLYAPFISYHDSDKLELVNLNVGAAINTTDGKGSPLFSVGFRADGLLKKLGAISWAKEHITTATLPALELAAGSLWYSPTHTWQVGLNAAYKF